MNKQTRQAVYNKFGGHCAYCGNEIEIKDMQIDHIIPQRLGGTDNITNLNPACRRCNHYKRAHSVLRFKKLMLTLHDRIRKNYICKVAEDYGIITVKEWDGKFYFEKVGGGER